jgi:hypothetical protein
MNLKKLFASAALFALVFSIFITACDMAFIPNQAMIESEAARNNARSEGCLTVFNLPGYMSAQKITNVQVYNQAGAIAQCGDYSAVEIEYFEGLSSVKVP